MVGLQGGRVLFVWILQSQSKKPLIYSTSDGHSVPGTAPHFEDGGWEVFIKKEGLFFFLPVPLIVPNRVKYLQTAISLTTDRNTPSLFNMCNSPIHYFRPNVKYHYALFISSVVKWEHAMKQHKLQNKQLNENIGLTKKKNLI